MTSSAGDAGQAKPTKISFVYSGPADRAAFEAAYPEQLALARKLPGLARLQGPSRPACFLVQTMPSGCQV